MEILLYPDPRLTAPNAPIGEWSSDLEKKTDDMRRLLTRLRGAGLAAPQVGWNVRLFILSIPVEGVIKKGRVIFDPVMTPIGDPHPMDEGCLSFPGIFGAIPRYDSVHIVGRTPEGPIDEEVNGFEAHAVQHEMDHLNGILFTEKMTPAELKLNSGFIRQLEENWRRQHPNG